VRILRWPDYPRGEPEGQWEELGPLQDLAIGRDRQSAAKGKAAAKPRSPAKGKAPAKPRPSKRAAARS
ncbi:MAG TPA: hypothetical protein VFU80_06555, partial [Sphingomicrobium sp.]|nr:hypothetical protein [Sphingomicrobium sp.]